MSAAPPERRRILALDPGDRRTGFAGTDHSGTIPLPLGTIEARNPDELLRKIRDVVLEREPHVIVVGVPVLAEGREGARAKKSLELIARLKRDFAAIEVVGIDEAHTTDEAHERLKSGGMRAAARKPRADAIAALVILERFLAGRR